ncbi:cytochrome c oxidase subunit II [Halobacteriales archaeon QS_1_68_20]|nr:MAG: cytochrome c oxidase subunit II [Halobacteriales archaeon QS_1_68_20]
MSGTIATLVTVLQSDGIIPRGSRVEVFDAIYWVFLVLGALVGIVVIGYMLYNAYKYRDVGETDEDAAESKKVERPKLGELPRGGGGGRKLFLSFTLSAIIVISLIAWAYGILLYVEEGAAEEPPTEQAEALEVQVEGYQFGWRFTYPNGHTVDSAVGDSFKVPADRMVRLNVTSADVFHNFGIPGLRVKSDAIPGQYTQQWFIAEDPGTNYTARCYELCGAGHSDMTATVEVMSQEEWQNWYEGTGNETETGDDGNQSDGGDDDGHALEDVLEEPVDYGMEVHA